VALSGLSAHRQQAAAGVRPNGASGAFLTFL